MWGKWERGVTPGGPSLIALAANGFDVMYLLTGQRPLKAAEQAALWSVRAKALLDNYEACDEEGRRSIERLAVLEAQSKELKRHG